MTLPPAELRVSLASVGAISVVTVEGELDIATTPRLTDVLEGLQVAGGDVAIDIAALEFIDSTGLEQLVAANERAKASGSSFVLAGARGAALRALQLSGIAGHVTLIDSIDGIGSPNGAGQAALNGDGRFDDSDYAAR